MRVAAFGLLLASLALAGPTVGASAAPDSGIAGVVRLELACQPVARTCARQVPTVTIRVLRPITGKLVATARPGRQGRFHIRLPSGRYLLDGVSPSGHTLVARRPVRVRPHAFTLVLLTTGERTRVGIR